MACLLTRKPLRGQPWEQDWPLLPKPLLPPGWGLDKALAPSVAPSRALLKASYGWNWLGMHCAAGGHGGGSPGGGIRGTDLESSSLFFFLLVVANRKDLAKSFNQ